MDGKELLKWGVIVLLALFAFRWVRGFLSVGDSQVSPTYNEGWPYIPGAVSFQPSIVSVPWSGRGYRGRNRPQPGNNRAQY